MCVLIGVNQLGFGAIVPVLPLYAQAFGVTVSAVGMAVAIYGFARFLIAMPIGQAVGRARPPDCAGPRRAAFGGRQHLVRLGGGFSRVRRRIAS